MIALDPSATFCFSLDIEAWKDEAQRIKFRCRFLTARCAAEIDRLTDEADGKPADQQKKLLLESVALASTVMTPPPATRRGSFCLDIDAGKPDGQLFQARAIPPEQAARMQELLDAASGATPGKAAELLNEAIAIGIEPPPGIENATLGELAEIAAKAIQLSRLWAAKSLDDLTCADLWEVVLKIIRLSGITENERKKSALRSAAAATRRSALNAPSASA